MRESFIPPSPGSEGSRAGVGEGSDVRPNWYCVRAIYRSVRIGQPRKRHLYERTFFVFRAAHGLDSSSLQEHAKRLAMEKEQEYAAVTGHTVRWVLDSIEDIKELIRFDPDEGGEVYWEFFERVDKQTS